MQFFLILALLFLSVLPLRADDMAALSQEKPGTDMQAGSPDPRLKRLEQELLRKLEEPGLDRRGPEYRQFAQGFRVRLDGTMEEVPPTSLNKGYHACILARLDEAGSRQAEADLSAGLERNPADHDLSLSLGFVQAQKGDYPSAAAAARAVLDFQGEPRPTPRQIAQARSLWHSTKDRGAGAGTSEKRSLPGTVAQTGPSVVVADDRPAVLAMKRGSARPSEVPATAIDGSDAENPPAPSPYWPWPAGWGLTFIGGAWALKRKLDDEKLTGSIAMTGAGISLLTFSMMFPPAASVTTPEGVQLILAPAVAKAAVGTVGSGLTAYGVKSGFESLISRAKGDKPENGDATSSQGGHDLATRQLRQSANEIDPADKGARFTKAGRSLFKHGRRPGTKLPQPEGSPESINQAARELIDSIVEHPQRTINRRPTGRFGRVVEIKRPDGIGVRYSESGEFIHFLD